MTAPPGSIGLTVGGGIATLTVNNAARRNCLSNEMLDQLESAAARIAADDEIRVVVLRGAGEKAFCAGADFESIAAPPDFMASFDATETRLNNATGAIAALSVPVIAAIRGACMGGGVQLALSADFRVAADDATLGIPAVKLGIVYPLDAIQRMVAMAGPSATKKLLIDPTPMDAATAHTIGFVDEVVPLGAFETRVAALAESIAGFPAPVVRAYKRIVDNIVAGKEEDNGAVQRAAHRAGDLVGHLSALAARRRARHGGS